MVATPSPASSASRLSSMVLTVKRGWFIQQLNGRYGPLACGIRYCDAAVFHAGHFRERFRLQVDRVIRRRDVHTEHRIEFARVNLRRRNENAYPARQQYLARPCSSRSQAPASTSVIIDNCVLDLVASFSISGNRSTVGTSASGDDCQVGFPTARQRFRIGGEFIRRFEQHAPAFQEHPS